MIYAVNPILQKEEIDFCFKKCGNAVRKIMKWEDFKKQIDWIEKKWANGAWITDGNTGFTRCLKHQTKFNHIEEICTECWKEAGNE